MSRDNAGIDPQATAAARLRLALRAEQAWGMSAVAGVKLRTLEPRRAAAPASPRAPKLPPKRPAAQRPATSKPKAATPNQPKTDLFGNPIAPEAAEPESVEAGFSEPPPELPRRIELLQALDQNEVVGCTKCPLHEGRTHTVFGEGDPAARLMFIGEGPGQNEDETGRPFVGRAGQMLDKWIGAMGLTREQVYIANVVKCRPPGNREPTALEVATCTHYLHKQIDWIRPDVIVTLGRPSTQHLLKVNKPMRELRGKWHDWRGLKVMPTYHPAYLLRAHTPANRRIVWEDLQLAMEALGLEAPKR